MVEVFKTNVPVLPAFAQEIIKELKALLPGYGINFDLTDIDRILRVEGEYICPHTIIQCINSFGYSASILDG